MTVRVAAAQSKDFSLEKASRLSCLAQAREGPSNKVSSQIILDNEGGKRNPSFNASLIRNLL